MEFKHGKRGPLAGDRLPLKKVGSPVRLINVAYGACLCFDKSEGSSYDNSLAPRQSPEQLLHTSVYALNLLFCERFGGHGRPR